MRVRGLQGLRGHKRRQGLALIVTGLVVSSNAAFAQIRVSPKQVVLNGKRDYRQLIVTTNRGGDTLDVTDVAAVKPDDPSIVTIHNGRITAIKDGRTTLSISQGAASVRIPITVQGCKRRDPVQFLTEVLPVLTKQGCASGSCHGSPHGKGGFSLSLYGYDPRMDRISLTRDGFSRRLDTVHPEDSLLLKKPQLLVPHVGGRKLRSSDVGYGLLRNWIAEGAIAEVVGDKRAVCESIEVTPAAGAEMPTPKLSRRLSVLARFSDGSTRDVTAITAFESTRPSVVTVDPDGLVTGVARGQAAVMVRYLQHLKSVHFTVKAPVPGFVWKATPEFNVVDRLVNAKLKQLRYLPSGVCSDPVFLRRITLDLTGLLPTADQARRFLADTAADKRSHLIDSLLETEEHARYWALKRADLMRVSAKRLPDGKAERFSEFLTSANRTNMPYDKFANALLTSSGELSAHPEAAYFAAIPETQERTEMTAQIFMGSRVECARCHNHPFEAWTMRDYYSIAAVFARTHTEKSRITAMTTGEVTLPTTGEVMRPWGTAQTIAVDASDRRVAFAGWLTKSGNPYFARVEVNRIWADLFGKGIVDPVDDFRSSNPPSNPELLDMLAAEFEKSGYDRKRIIRLIANSAAYQRETATNKFNATEDSLFSHARVRLLSAEQIQDAVGFATHSLRPLVEIDGDVPAAQKALDDRIAELKATGASTAAIDKDGKLRDLRGRLSRVRYRMEYATQRPYPEQTAFTVAFGQPARESACTCERRSAPTLLQALELLNGGLAYDRVRNSAPKWAAMADSQLVEELYLSSVIRLPVAAERTAALAYLKRDGDRTANVTDLVWTLINTQEFLFQH